MSMTCAFGRIQTRAYMPTMPIVHCIHIGAIILDRSSKCCVRSILNCAEWCQLLNADSTVIATACDMRHGHGQCRGSTLNRILLLSGIQSIHTLHTNIDIVVGMANLVLAYWSSSVAAFQVQPQNTGIGLFVHHIYHMVPECPCSLSLHDQLSSYLRLIWFPTKSHKW